MSSRFDSTAWHNAMAELLGCADASGCCHALVAALDLAVSNDGTCLIAFRPDAPPAVVHHSMPPAVARHYLDRYLAGPYLLDPLYQLAIGNRRATACRFRDATPDRFRSSHYYRRYYERTHLRDEMDFLLRVTDGTALVLVVGRRQKMFTRAELRRLQLIEKLLFAALRNIWQLWDRGTHRQNRDANLHRRLMHCFENFGGAALTDRERQITQLLLRGHSAKSVARELRIAPGTVMVHKRNLFAKLGITTQYELFSRLIKDLENS
ncbi:MAG: helix-turn-helix transcriptional regulator [Gammaproteobacteria bacterium]|nr:helix-turn-helix transcriptional regulator [Gammaproteobacteria bacterium]MDH5302565.1 helix-turn-helix transcriptional regulator [Gammaproteobacteria bacterium]MDH5321044.1 helix-turn-helix transcriptional regulator [Gammaproteobacteria bacterium]